MAKNIVICCDGTGNEVDANLSNVLKLYRLVKKNNQQIVFYDPGVGTISSSDPWSRFKANALGVWGLMTGWGLDANILEAYRFLIEHYRDGDQIFLFGFSRGAYTVRVLAGFLNLVGLLDRKQANLSEYALTTYKKAADKNDYKIAWRFERIMSTRRPAIRFVGVWDTVSSMIVPRPDRFYLPSLQELPYTKTNPLIEIFRQANAIDERRRMFRLNRWNEPQVYKPNPFDPAEPPQQDIKQVWFSGVHSDIGGGYPEADSGAAKFPLQWMIDEAEAAGLLITKQMYNHLVLGKPRKGGSRKYVAPNAAADLHNSMTFGWWLLEELPKRVKRREWPKRKSLFGWYFPRGEPRVIGEGALVHHSVFERFDSDADYRPENLSPKEAIKVAQQGGSDIGKDEKD
jgi:uncharacterized protein (DUF2235 family)